MLSPGAIIGTHYKVIRLLGQGGMSNIYICEELTSSGVSSGQTWAVKEFTATYADPQEQKAALANFEREAYLLRQLSHPNLPKIREYFQFQGKYYLAMEYLQGSDLGKILEQTKGPLPDQKVADLGLQMTTVLYYLHCQKPTPIIFRDVKPSNIILCGDRIKLIDFGIARLFTPGKRGDTMRIGSPGYAPPEQYSGQTDQRSDIYALGMTLHQCLTGHDPTLSPNPFVVKPVLELNPQVSPQLAAIVQKAIKLIPEERYQSMLEMKRELRNFLGVRSGTDSLAAQKLGRTVPASASMANLASAAAPAISASSVPSAQASAAPVLPIPPFTPANPQISSASLPPAVENNAHKGGTSLVSPSLISQNITVAASPLSPTSQASSVSASAPSPSNRISTVATPQSNFGPPVIIPVDEDEMPGAWKRTAFKVGAILVAWAVIGSACAIISGWWPIELPELHEPFNSRRAALLSALQPSREDLSPNDYRSVYKYTVNRFQIAEILDARIKSFPRDFVAKALKSNLDNMLSRRRTSFVGNAEYEKLYKGDLDKIESLTDPSRLYLDNRTKAAMLGPDNTISLVLPTAQNLAETDSTLARGALAAQDILQNGSKARGKGVMISPIFSSNPLSSPDLAHLLSEQLCQDAPIPVANQLNSQVIISDQDISQIWQKSSVGSFSLSPKLSAPALYFNLDKTEKLPSLGQILQASIRDYAHSGPVFILETDPAFKFSTAEKASGHNCNFINSLQKLPVPAAGASGGTVVLTPAQLKANLNIPSQYKIVLLVSTPEAVDKLRKTLPAEWINSRRLSIWALASYQHPHKQALALLNSSLLEGPISADFVKFYKTLKAADAFTLGALHLRQAQGSFSGALANYDLAKTTFTPVSCQAFTVTAHGFSPVVSPSPRQGKLEE